ncbi:transposase [Streptomyces sp. NPDC005876]|uniref:transposase n=2 Tax=Streptomyces TaxID=1883 RepID=UPI003408A157
MAGRREVPVERAVMAYVRACGVGGEEEALRLWRAARAESRGRLCGLRAPHVDSIHTRAALFAALAAVYERAGAPGPARTAAGVVGQIRDQLRKRIRREMGRAPGAVATVIDSQSVKAAETVGKDSRGYVGAKKINGRKRHLVVDTKGLPLFVMVTPADTTDRDAAKEVLFRLRLMHPEITIVWADSGYAGQLLTWAKKNLDLTLKTISRPKDAVGFVILPRRWVVERSLAWIMHARRHARDYERLIQHSESLITWAAITLMTRRITRRSSRRSTQPASREANRD